MKSAAASSARSGPAALARILGTVAAAILLGVGAGCGDGADSAVPSDEEAVQIFLELHAGMYGAFAQPDESAVYDALSTSVDGELLERIYREIYSSLVAKEHGGVVSEILEVTPIETELIASPKLDAEDVAQFQVRAVWEVNSVASHEGHSHLRSHQYEALYRVARSEQGWHIVDDRMLRQRRLGEAWQIGTQAPAP